jgi:hypothetical protein
LPPLEQPSQYICIAPFPRLRYNIWTKNKEHVSHLTHVRRSVSTSENLLYRALGRRGQRRCSSVNLKSTVENNDEPASWVQDRLDYIRLRQILLVMGLEAAIIVPPQSLSHSIFRHQRRNWTPESGAISSRNPFLSIGSFLLRFCTSWER